jgi:hypothetical protein
VGRNAVSADARCRTLRAGRSSDGVVLALAPGGATVEARGGEPALLHLGRFATGAFSFNPGEVPGGEVGRLEIPRDSVRRRWLLQVEADRSVTVCGTGAR